MPTVQFKMVDGESVDVTTYSSSVSDPDILFVHHGANRSAYSSGSERLADREGLAVFSPIFPESRYGSDEYQQGGVVDDRGRVLPEDQWTTRLEEPMIDWARSEVGGDADVYLFGFSGGGQFLNRVAAYERPEGVSRIVVGSPSTWVLPSLTEDAPYGFDGLGTDAEEREALQEYLALPMTIYLGSEDDNPNDSDLSKGAAAMRQGSDRLERGINTFEMGQEVADANGWDFNWRLVIADGVGHSGSSMLRAAEMTDALRPGDWARANVAAASEDPIDDESPSVDQGAADDFRFSGDIREGTNVSHIDELNFDEGDTLSFVGYDRGTFGRNGTSAEIDSISELRALDQTSRAVSLSSSENADLIIEIDQGRTMHQIVVHELSPDALL